MSAVIVIAFSLAALTGIAVLVRGGDLGETQSRVLGTTALIGAASLAVLCCLPSGGTASRVVGGLGIAVTLLPLVAGLVLVWSDPDGDGWMRALYAGILLTFSLAHAALLLAVPTRTRAERWLLAATLAVTVVLVCLLMPLILHDFDPGETFYRALGIVAILSVLGTLALPALVRMRAPAPVGGPRSVEAVQHRDQSMPCERLKTLAVREGRTPGEVLVAALDLYEAKVGSSGRVHAGAE